MYIEVREPGTNWLLFRFDPQRDLIEIVRGKRKTVIDLSCHRELSKFDSFQMKADGYERSETTLAGS